MKEKLSGQNTWKRIRGMTLKGSDNANAPNALLNGRSTQWLTWDPEELDRWLDQGPRCLGTLDKISCHEVFIRFCHIAFGSERRLPQGTRIITGR